MVEKCLAKLGVRGEVEVNIQKNLPVQGGMGAGSANAAAALLGLERELGVALPGVERLKLAGGIGSDVPLVLFGGAGFGGGGGGVGGSSAGFAWDCGVGCVPHVGGFTAA